MRGYAGAVASNDTPTHRERDRDALPENWEERAYVLDGGALTDARWRRTTDNHVRMVLVSEPAVAVLRVVRLQDQREVRLPRVAFLAQKLYADNRTALLVMSPLRAALERSRTAADIEQYVDLREALSLTDMFIMSARNGALDESYRSWRARENAPGPRVMGGGLPGLGKRS